MLAYWVNLQGQYDLHPAKSVLAGCWEHNEKYYASFGWIGDARAGNIELRQLQYSPTISISSIPPWLFPLPSVDLRIQQEIKEKSEQLPISSIVQNNFNLHYLNLVFIFTDGSK